MRARYGLYGYLEQWKWSCFQRPFKDTGSESIIKKDQRKMLSTHVKINLSSFVK